jgi:ribosomal protein S18 acetylase RimI-like enzyme
VHSIRKIEQHDEIKACFSVLKELRPHLLSVDDFVKQVLRQREQGYHLIAHLEESGPLAVVGYRTLENFVHGRFIYVDDLVVSNHARGKRIGGHLLEYVFREASLLGLNKVVLDTALNNALAQRFYFRQEMLATGLHFTISL